MKTIEEKLSATQIFIVIITFLSILAILAICIAIVRTADKTNYLDLQTRVEQEMEAINENECYK